MNDAETEPRPGAGHNLPAPLTAREITAFLDDALTGLLNRRGVVIAGLSETVTAHPRIEDDEVLGIYAENVRMGRTLTRTSDDRRVEQKKPFLEGGRTVDGWFKRFVEPVERALANAQTVMDDYGRRKLAAERARLAAEREAREAEAAQAAQAALDQGFAHVDSETAWTEAANAADAAELAARAAGASAAELTRSYGTYGAVASVRTNWTWQITDAQAIPRAFLCPDEAKLKAAARTRERDTGRPLAIPGIAWVETHKVGIR